MRDTPTRISFATQLWREGLWGKWVGAAWAAYGVFLQLKESMPENQQAPWWPVVALIPSLPIAWWAVGAALVFLAWCFEASYRVQRKALAQVADLETALAQPEHKLRSLIDEKLAQDRRVLAEKLIELKSETWVATDRYSMAVKFTKLNSLSGLFMDSDEFRRRWYGILNAQIAYIEGKPTKIQDETSEDYALRTNEYLKVSSTAVDEAVFSAINWLLMKG